MNSDLLEVAKLGRTVGLKGALKLHNLSDFESQFKKGAKFFTKDGGLSPEDIDEILEISYSEFYPKSPISGHVRTFNLMKYYRGFLMKTVTDEYGNKFIDIPKFFEKHGKDTVLVYSMWSGYIDQEPRLQELEKEIGDRFIRLHSSGHASRELIQATLDICGKAKVLPMHTESFAEFHKICRGSRIVDLKAGEKYVVG
mgnify:CR=1 FL=1